MADLTHQVFHPPMARPAARENTGLTAGLVRDLNVQGEFWMSEQGVALDFAEKNDARLRFVAEDRSWIAWTGTHWSEACAETLAERFYSELIAGTLQRTVSASSDKQHEALIDLARFMGRRGMRS